MFITFEGVDYSGKSTQAALAVDRLTALGRRVRFVREPGGTELAERVRGILLEKSQIAIDPVAELLLFAAARAQLVREVILPSLRDGTIVVCDRFHDSTTAYQGYGRDLPLTEVRAINAFSTAGATPDLTLIVEVDPAEIRRRRAAAGAEPDRMERSGDDFYRKVAEGYRKIAAEDPARVVVVPGEGAVEATHAAIWSVIETRLTRAGTPS